MKLGVMGIMGSPFIRNQTAAPQALSLHATFPDRVEGEVYSRRHNHQVSHTWIINQFFIWCQELDHKHADNVWHPLQKVEGHDSFQEYKLWAAWLDRCRTRWARRKMGQRVDTIRVLMEDPVMNPGRTPFRPIRSRKLQRQMAYWAELTGLQSISTTVTHELSGIGNWPLIWNYHCIL